MGESAPEYYRGVRSTYFTNTSDHYCWTPFDYDNEGDNCTNLAEFKSNQSKEMMHTQDLVGDTDWDSLNTKVTLRYFSPDNYQYFTVSTFIN